MDARTPDGEAGLELAAQIKPELILLDSQMPVMDGFETLQALRADPQTARIPIVTVSGAIATRGHCAEMIARSQAYLPKPLDFIQLINVLQRLLASQQVW